MATITFTCGAECSSLSHWTAVNGACSISTTQKLTGTSAIKIIATTSGGINVNYTGSSTSVKVIRFSIYLDGLPTADSTLQYFLGNPNDAIVGFDQATGKLCVAEQGNWAGRVLGPVIANQTWTTIDVKYDYSAGAPTISWRVDGSAQTTYTGSGSTGTYSTLYLPMYSVATGIPAASNFTAYYDDLGLSVTTGDFPLSGSASSTGTDSMRFAAHYTGAATPVAAATANSTALQLLDSTALGSRFVRETTAGRGSRPVGFATGTTDDWALVAVAVREAPPPPTPPAFAINKRRTYPQLLAQ